MGDHADDRSDDCADDCADDGANDGADHRPNVVLTGFMGTGKTTVGRVLADVLGYEFVDTDTVIVEEHGPIADIFTDHGEAHFRQLERDLAARLAGRDGVVVSTGGRMLVDPINAEVFQRSGLVVALTATVDTIFTRVGGERAATTRPMLAGGDVRTRIADLIAERADAYGRFRQVPTDGREPGEIADEIAALVHDSLDSSTDDSADERGAASKPRDASD